MTTYEEMLEAMAEVVARQARVARAEATLAKAQRQMNESLVRLTRVVRARDASVELTPKVTAALDLAQALPPATLAGDEPTGTLRDRIVAVMETSPDEVYTPARLAPLLGGTNRDTIRNTLLALASRGKIKKRGPGQYQAQRKRGSAP